jgi:hypothetical protein
MAVIQGNLSIKPNNSNQTSEVPNQQNPKGETTKPTIRADQLRPS